MAILVVAVFGACTDVRADDFFESQVVPILQQRCLGCHNEQDRKGGFSLQTASSVFDNGHVEAGNSDASPLIDEITPVDGQANMPKDADPLSVDELAVIRKWIDDGASWSPDFMLSPPCYRQSGLVVAQSPSSVLSVPSASTSNPDGTANGRDRKSGDRQHDDNTSKRNSRKLKIRTPIDAFIQEALDAKELVASPEADRQTLIRRLYFDIIGLPPSPDAVTEFLNDDEADAYERLVDRLLASNHYGERWARHWLDVVHYADTHGYDKDKLRPNAWPYRDYVIRAFNADKPYSRFVQEQIAGDALWPNTTDGITATGFIAAGPWDFIGHAEVPETKIDGRIARNLDRDDMVTSTLNTFCSVTVQCARCHNHKFDPITQEHYYSLQAVFAAIDRADRPFDADPQTARMRSDLNQRRNQLLAEKERLDVAVQESAGDRLLTIDNSLAKLKRQKEDGPKTPEYGYHSQIAESADTTKWVQVDLGKPMAIAEIRYVGCHDDFAGIGHGFGFPVRYRIEASDDAKFKDGVQLIESHTAQDVPNPGTSLQTVLTDAKARYIRVTATKLAERSNDYIFALAELMAISKDGENVALGKQVTSHDSIEAPARWQRKNLVDGYYVGASEIPNLQYQIKALEAERHELLRDSVPKSLRLEVQLVDSKLAEANQRIDKLPQPQMVYAGTIHTGSGAFKGTGANGGKPRPIHVLHRGDILSPRTAVGPGTLPLIAGCDWKFDLPHSHRESDRRVALAKWLTRNDNPLTWRSIVNRVWHYHFGRGIVDTPNDFGRMGKLPSHPKLLNWLAMEFRDGGQRFKPLHKMIVMSSVYRQSSSHNAHNAAIDSGNEFLWRMNRRRLSAEEVRDAVLCVSGKLNRDMYGPGFQLFVLERPEHSPHYEYHKHDPDDPMSHRRSIYRFIVRSQPDPFMTTLDCADSSQSVAKRDETLTALQALSLLNNKFMVRMAEHFAARVADSDSPINEAYRLVTGHSPSPEQASLLTEYSKKHGNANLCRLLLNTSEFVFVD